MKMAFPIQYELIIKESTLKKETKKERKSLGREKPKLNTFHVSLLAGIDHLKSQKWKVSQLCFFLKFPRVHDHLLSLASPLVPDESGASGGKTPIAAPPPTFASGRRNREDSYDT